MGRLLHVERVDCERCSDAVALMRRWMLHVLMTRLRWHVPGRVVVMRHRIVWQACTHDSLIEVLPHVAGSHVFVVCICKHSALE